MKRHLQALVAVFCLLGAPNAHAGWFDGWFEGWFDGWFEGWFDGWFQGVDPQWLAFYGGGGMHVVRAEFPGQLQRRVGGDPSVDPSTFFLNEPGIVTAGFARFGWQPIDYLGVELLAGAGIDKDQYSEQPDGQIKLDSISGIYLRPQYKLGSFTFFGLLGQSDYEFTVTENGMPRNNEVFADGGFAWGGGVELHVARQGRLAFEFLQHYQEDDPGNNGKNEVTGIGISFTYHFGGSDDGGDDDYY